VLELLIVLALIAAFDIAAVRWGADSRGMSPNSPRPGGFDRTREVTR
jgi:hypothetical protein